MPRKVKRSHQRNKSKRINACSKRIRKRKLSSKRKRKSKNIRNRKRKSMQRGGTDNSDLVERIKSTLLGLDGSEMAKGILKALFNTEKKSSLESLQSLWTRNIEIAAKRGIYERKEDGLLQLRESPSSGKLRPLLPDNEIIADLMSIYTEVNKGKNFPGLENSLPQRVYHRETCIVMIVYLWWLTLKEVISNYHSLTFFAKADALDGDKVVVDPNLIKSSDRWRAVAGNVGSPSDVFAPSDELYKEYRAGKILRFFVVFTEDIGKLKPAEFDGPSRFGQRKRRTKLRSGWEEYERVVDQVTNLKKEVQRASDRLQGEINKRSADVESVREKAVEEAAAQKKRQQAREEAYGVGRAGNWAA